jgi:hypothetical protein
LGLSEVVDNIQHGDYHNLCMQLREVYPLAQVRRKYDGGDGMLGQYTKMLPRVCFSSVMENRKGQRMVRQYNGLVLLEVNNLTGTDEAEAVRKGASQIPQTMLAFVGASGRSVKIVCRGELFQGDVTPPLTPPLKREGNLPTADDDVREGNIPVEVDDVKRFHVNLYEKARLAYNMQLGVTIEKLEPVLDRCCYVSSDAALYYNPQSQPFYTDCADLVQAAQPLVAHDAEQQTLMPGMDDYHAMRLIYEYCLSKAYDDVEGIGEDEGRTHLLLTRLAGYCRESGLPMAVAQRLALFNQSIGREADVVRKVFDNAYREEHEKQ